MQTQSFNSLSNRKANVHGELVARDRMLSLELTKLKTITAVVETNRRDIEDYEKAISLCRACIDEQADAKRHVENIATALLNGVMQGVHEFYELTGEKPTYEFILEQVQDDAGAVVGLKPMIIKNGIADEPKNFGGGVQNLVSFAIRLIYVLLNPGVSQTLILDEPMTNLSPKAWRFVVRFLEDLQRDLGLQVIAITHSGAQFPNTWVVYREGDTSYVRFDNQD